MLFSFQSIIKQIFLSDFAKNKKMEKFQIFDENHGATPLEKLSRFFDFFNFLVFWSLKMLFSFQSIIKQIFLSDFAKNKKMEKFQIFDENHGATPLEKLSRFFDFFNFLILESKNSFFLSRIIIVKHILLADFAKNRNIEKISKF